MSRNYRFRIVNVFAESRLAGNPLAVIEDARGLSDIEMQQLALQFNLSETTFIFANVPDREDQEAAVHGRTSQQQLGFDKSLANAKVRIFTPTFEMPFAGHPTLGTAHVVRTLGWAGDALQLEMRAGVISVTAQGDVWTLTAKAPTWRDYEFSSREAADALGLHLQDIAGAPLWVNAGVEQLIVPLRDADAVARAAPNFALCSQHCRSEMEANAYVFAPRDERSIVARFFFQHGNALVEDPGTGSACANLGGWHLATGTALPLQREIHQGAATGRPCLLHLAIDADRRVQVGGRVIEIGRGELTL